ncbi:MAG: hypothetical protein AAB855_04145, partial [Patescibacteria group bacterium]
MIKDLNAIKTSAQRSIKNAKTLPELDAVELSLFGRKQGALTTLLKSLKDLPEQERKERGGHANAVKNDLTRALDERRDMLRVQEEGGLFCDIGEPYVPSVPRGSIHPITRVREDLEDCFIQMGYRV